MLLFVRAACGIACDYRVDRVPAAVLSRRDRRIVFDCS